MSEGADTLRDGGAGTEAFCPACGKSFPPHTGHCPNDGAILVRLSVKVDPLIGRVFEQRYEIRAQLGEGGMGAVYRAWQLSVDREVAIKVIDPRLSSSREIVKRFLREARLSSRLGQASIVNVYDFGQTEDGILYIVMELLRGHTLAKELAVRGVFSVERTIGIGIQLCDALEAAHKLEIVHRDLKPGNVVILDEPPGRDLVKVLDFGLAKSLVSDAVSKLTHSDAIVGTPLYMSPEQIQGHASDQRTDLYSLGCMLHEMLSGAAPFQGKTVDRVLSNHMYELAAPLPPDVPAPIAALILRLISKRPDERPGSAAEVRDTLLAHIGLSSALGARVMAGAAVASAAPSVVTHAPAPRRGWLVAFAALVSIAAVVTALALTRHRGARSTVPAIIDGRLVDTAPALDAAVSDATVTPVDVLTPIDAAPPQDAPRPHRVDSRPLARPPVKPVIDAGGELEFYRLDAAR